MKPVTSCARIGLSRVGEAVAAEHDFFDIDEVRRLTIEVERLRRELVRTASEYARLDYEIYNETDELHRAHEAAQRDYAAACVLLVNAMHGYWPEFFCPF